MGVCIYESDVVNGVSTKKQLVDELTQFRDEFPAAVVAELDAVWEKVRDKAIELCPKSSGALASSIELESEGGSGKTGMRGDNDFYSNAIYAGNDQTFNFEGQPTSSYVLSVHDGHLLPNGVFLEGTPFLTDAVDFYMDELESCVDRAMKDLLGD